MEMAAQPRFQYSVPCRVFKPTRKAEIKIFMLRNLSASHFSSLDCLKGQISSQLGESVVSADGDYDVGYMKGTSRLCIHSEGDLDEIWSKISRGVACTLWCDGLAPQEKSKSVSKRLYYDGSDSDPENLSPLPPKKKKMSAIEEKNQRVQELIRSIQDKHGEKFTKIQYRLWAEMIDVGTHKSLDEAPSVPMFTSKARQTQSSALTNAFTNMASSIASALSNNQTPTKSSSAGSSSSPVRVVQLRSQYIQQLKDLHSLYEAGALSEQEYAEEKDSILAQLKKMTPRQ